MPLRRLSVLALIALAACESGFGPGDVDGRRYVLESVSSKPLPATISGEGWSYVMIADTIAFTDARRGLQVAIAQWPGKGPERSTLPFIYEVKDGRIEVTYECPPNASCIEGPHLFLRRRGDDFTATYPPSMPRRDSLRYRATGS